MRIEHIAFQMPDPRAAAEWYAEHLGFRVLKSWDDPPFGRFMVDAGGAVVLEIYRNEAAPVPDYTTVDPLCVHVAFVAVHLEAERDRLLAAGATLAQEVYETPTGDRIAMLRDPWGFPLQLVNRAVGLR